MTKDFKAASRYAFAFFDWMKKKGRADAAHSELLAVQDFVRTHKEFGRLLLTTTISDSEKEALIESLLGPDRGSKELVSTETRNFIKLLVEKNRFNLFEKVVESVHKIYNEENGIEEVTLVTAVPVEDAIIQRLKGVLEGKLKKKVLIETRVEPEIIGGAIVYTRDEIIDGSLREKLRGLKQSLMPRTSA